MGAIICTAENGRGLCRGSRTNDRLNLDQEGLGLVDAARVSRLAWVFRSKGRALNLPTQCTYFTRQVNA